MPLHLINEVNDDPQVAIYKRKVTLTDAQIKALPTTSIDLVDAPGAGKMILPHAVRYVLNNEAGAYTNLDGTTCLLVTKVGGLILNSVYDENAEGNFGAAYKWFMICMLSQNVIGGATYAYSVGATPTENEPLKLVLANGSPSIGDLTGGHADNSMKITVFYSIVDA
jgi:hypothetical protein